jgi:hypothetical protein
MTTPPDPTQELYSVLADILNFSTSVINFVADDLLPLVPDGLETAGIVLETIVEPLVENFRDTVCG